MSQNLRYLNRVTLPAEAAAIRDSRSPVLAFSAVWAAKEAAFKMFSKLGVCGHFVPRKLVSTFCGDPALCETKGVVEFGMLNAFFYSQISEDWVHVVATPTASTVVQGRVVEKIGAGAGGFPSPQEETAGVRELAAKLLAAQGLSLHTLRYDRRIPFLALADGTASHIQISMSHHGRFAGVAIAAREARPVAYPDGDCRPTGSRTMEELCSTCMG